QEKRIGLEFGSEAMHQQLLSVPGIGPTLAAVIACEVDSIERFSSAEKLCAYAGVVPHHSFQRRQDKPWATPALLQQVVALGFDRSKLGSDRLLALLWCSLQTTSGAWEESQQRRAHRSAPDVPHHLAALTRKTRL